jgi:hypothetical protein
MVALRIVRRDPAVTGDKSPLIDPRTIGLCTAQAHYALLILKQELLRYPLARFQRACSG